jgi:hypothetical protein
MLFRSGVTGREKEKNLSREHAAVSFGLLICYRKFESAGKNVI